MLQMKELLEIAVAMGRKADFRSAEEIKEKLTRVRKQYESLPEERRIFFDKEGLTNPYLDSRIHFCGSVRKIKKVLAGIDIDSAELMVARYLSNHNPKSPVDAVIAHHPLGKALADLGEVMDMQVDILEKYGVPINVAESLMHMRIGEVSRGVSASNHFKAVDTARLLDMNLLNVHTPADNLVARFVEEKVSKDKPRYLSDVLASLLEIPEYAEAAKRGSGPRLFTGNEHARVGKIAFSEITGGTEGSKDIYQRLAQVGIGTVISMHQSEEHRKQAEAAHINVVIAGHISSDSLGMNLYLDELERRGVEIVPCSGLIRFSRNKKGKKK